MQFVSSNWRDIQKYYEGTYVKFSEFGDKLFYIENVSPESVRGKDEDNTVFELFLSDNVPYNVDYILPHKAVFQFKDTVALLQRIPARQYRRGLCSDNTQIVNVLSGSKYDVGFATLKAFVGKQPYHSFSQAFTTKVKAKAVPLTSRMTYVRTGSILIDHVTVANYDHNTKRIVMQRPIFLPEIMQHMMDHNEVYEVIK